MTTPEAAGDTDDAVELLSSPPTTDDLDDLLETAAPHRRSKLTFGLVAALIFVVGFLAGSISEKLAISMGEGQPVSAYETEEADAIAQTDPEVVGQVVMLDDGVVYVSRADGATLKVQVSDGTVIGLSRTGRIEDLAPGDAVIIHGETSADGSIEASSIQQSRPGP